MIQEQHEMLYIKLFLLFGAIGAIGGGYAYHQVTVSKFEAGIAKLEANNRTLKENQVQLDIAINTAGSITQSSRRER